MPDARRTPLHPAHAGETGTVPDERIERSRGQPLSNSTARQRRVALMACLAMLAVTALLLPFASVDIGVIPAFFPVQQSVAIGSCLITAYLLYAHFQAVGAVPLLNLGAGYAYTALVLCMQMLAFQGLFLEGTQAFGGPQTMTWLWLFWHLGPASSVLFLALTDSRREVHPRTRRAAQQRAGLALATATGATAVLVFGYEAALPVLDVAGNYSAITSSGLAPALQVLLAVTLVVLWRASRFRKRCTSGWPSPWSPCSATTP